MRTEAEIKEALGHLRRAVEVNQRLCGDKGTVRFVEGMKEVLEWVADEEPDGEPFTFSNYLDVLRSVKVRFDAN